MLRTLCWAILYAGLLVKAMPQSVRADASTDNATSQETAVALMKQAAVDFLESLAPALREKATFTLTDAERKKWSNLPAAMFKREGVNFGEMTPEQRVLAHRLIQSPLSSQGYLKVTGIMKLDDILKAIQRLARPGRPSMFGHDLYWVGIFGDPKTDKAWGWQLDGHHLALNFTIVGNKVSVTPAFLGSDPAEVRTGEYSGWRILAKEDDRGRALFNSLNKQQRAKAILSVEAPRDVITGPGRGDLLKKVSGLPASDMTAKQRTLLMAVLNEYAHNLDHGLAHAQLERIRAAGIDKLHFAWAGTEPDKPYYYRIHGPTVLIEFDNSFPPGGRESGPINHIHTVWRDTENDYGEDLLQKHYRESPHHQPNAAQK